MDLIPAPEYEKLLDAYRSYLQLERGMTANTRMAYLADVRKFADWAASDTCLLYTSPSPRDS